MTFPATVLRLALRKARRWAKHRQDGDHAILMTAMGSKFSRAVGYGESRQICVKFLIQEKKTGVPISLRVPEEIEVRHRGVAYRVPTDVVAVGQVNLHVAVLESFVNGTRREIGTPGCLLMNSAGRKFLLTAGHLFAAGPLPAGTPQGTLEIKVNGVYTGDLINEASNLVRDNLFLDMGITTFPPPNYQGQLAAPPWNSLVDYFRDSQMTMNPRDPFGSGPMKAQVCGSQRQPVVEVDTVITQPLRVSDMSLPIAPPLFLYRSLPGQPANIPGDSGAAVVVIDTSRNARTNMILAIHVAGPSEDGGGEPLGWGVPVCTIIDILEAKFQQQFAVISS